MDSSELVESQMLVGVIAPDPDVVNSRTKAREFQDKASVEERFLIDKLAKALRDEFKFMEADNESWRLVAAGILIKMGLQQHDYISYCVPGFHFGSMLAWGLGDGLA